MASKWTQGKGSAQFGTVSPAAMVDYKSDITSVKFVFTREKNEIAANLGTGERDTELGNRQRVVEVTFNTELAAAGFYRRQYTAIAADGELDFNIVMSDAAVSANNPRRTGKIVVTESMIGGQIGKVRSNQLTFRIKAGTYVKAAV